MDSFTDILLLSSSLFIAKVGKAQPTDTDNSVLMARGRGQVWAEAGKGGETVTTVIVSTIKIQLKK